MPKAFILQTSWVHLSKLVQGWLKANKLGPNAEFYFCVPSLKGIWIWFFSAFWKFGDQCYLGKRTHGFGVLPGQVRFTNPKIFLGKYLSFQDYRQEDAMVEGRWLWVKKGQKWASGSKDAWEGTKELSRKTVWGMFLENVASRTTERAHGGV